MTHRDQTASDEHPPQQHRRLWTEILQDENVLPARLYHYEGADQRKIDRHFRRRFQLPDQSPSWPDSAAVPSKRGPSFESVRGALPSVLFQSW